MCVCVQCSKLRSDTGHFPDNFRIYFFCPGKMSAQHKRGLQSSADQETFFVEENGREMDCGERQRTQYIPLNWLKFETAAEDRDHVATLKCAVRSRFKERLQPMRNYRPTLIEELIFDETIKFIEICTFWHSLCFYQAFYYMNCSIKD